MIVIYSECDLLSAGHPSSLFEDFGIELLQIASAKSISEQFTSARGARIKAAQTTDSKGVSTSRFGRIFGGTKLVAIIEHSYNRQLHMGNEEKIHIAAK